ncbi:hypothetical protein TSUD_20810 [Trifolium subterraneum]|uniref:BHLH domain-containing protein n=1 Tax=Trifolium subterraneum TaxID=3900 RepID=A0A2Z6MM85_TRISU|nr:hypothetical protein TSUD_20810 [Trifolium subterraneum]
MAPASETSNSFTALLELPPTQVVQLLHSPEITGKPPKPYPLTSNTTARFSVFAGENKNSANLNVNSVLPEVKDELPETEGGGCVSDPTIENKKSKGAKRKEREKKVKVSSKKSKSIADENSGNGGDELPYVHVRVRRGQATDSHSLAERARREKINARMKLLQELVPGCNKEQHWFWIKSSTMCNLYSTKWRVCLPWPVTSLLQLHPLCGRKSLTMKTDSNFSNRGNPMHSTNHFGGGKKTTLIS